MADGSIPITQIRTLELREADIYSESHTCKSTGPREGSVSLNAVPRANLLEPPVYVTIQFTSVTSELKCVHFMFSVSGHYSPRQYLLHDDVHTNSPGSP